MGWKLVVSLLIIFNKLVGTLIKWNWTFQPYYSLHSSLHSFKLFIIDDLKTIICTKSSHFYLLTSYCLIALSIVNKTFYISCLPQIIRVFIENSSHHSYSLIEEREWFDLPACSFDNIVSNISVWSAWNYYLFFCFDWIEFLLLDD